jgi:hypothetical protein
MTWKGKLVRILQAFSFSAEAVPKIHTVILSEAKNLIIFFSSQQIKKEILRTKVLYKLKKTWENII